MYDTILVPLDGSDASKAALTFAVALPAAHIRVLRVDHETDPGLDALGASGREGRAESSATLTEELRRMVAETGVPEAQIELDVRFGDPAEVIIEEGSKADLIVMTTHGRGAAGRAIFGSTADRVSRHASTPTLLLRAGTDGTAAPVISRIVVPLDGSSLAENALPAARTMASAIGKPMHLVRVVDPVGILATFRHEYEAAGASPLMMTPEYDDLRAQQEQKAATYLNEQREQVAATAGQVTSEVRTGTPSFVLLDLVGPADLLVMTSHGRSGFRRWLLGSVAEKLVREAAAPVLLVPAREVGAT